MAVFDKYSVGFNHVGSYQASARPWSSASVLVPVSGGLTTSLEISFPKVTKFIVIRNEEHDSIADTQVRLAFNSGGIGPTYNYILIDASSSFSADYRVTRLYFMSETSVQPKISVIAGLTNIDASHLTSSWASLDGVG